MEFIENLDDPLGIGLLVVGGFIALRAAKTVLKVAMLAVAAVGLYLWLGL